jgi:hypothetical protein
VATGFFQQPERVNRGIRHEDHLPVRTTAKILSKRFAQEVLVLVKHIKPNDRHALDMLLIGMVGLNLAEKL